MSGLRKALSTVFNDGLYLCFGACLASQGSICWKFAVAGGAFGLLRVVLLLTDK